MSEKEVHEPVPYFTYEATLARMERIVKRLWILDIMLFVALVISNAAWSISLVNK